MACLLDEGSYKCEGLLRDPYECQGELGNIAKIAEASFVSSFVMYWAAILGSVNVKRNLAIFQNN